MTEENKKELARLEALLEASQGNGYKERREAIQAAIDALRASETPSEVEEPKETTPPLDLNQT